MQDIYRRSRYYDLAHAMPNHPPYGSPDPSSCSSTQSNHKAPSPTGPPINKYPMEKSHIKIISPRPTPNKEVSKCLTVALLQRKTQYISGTNLQFQNQTLTTLLPTMQQFFMPGLQRQDQQRLQLLQFASAMGVLGEAVSGIRDYALSTYFVYYTGQNKRIFQFLEAWVKDQFLEYDNQILINSSQLARPQLRKIDYSDSQKVLQYVRDIFTIGQEKDQHFNGVHFYISDWLPEVEGQLPFQQQQLWPLIQFNLTVLTHILADGQHCLLKIRGSHTHKTSQYIFLLKLCFSRIHFHKHILSNPFTHDKYLICEHFHKENGKMVAEHLVSNYHLLGEQRDNMLLVDQKMMFMQDFQLNITNFNDLSPIFRVIKDHLPLIQQHKLLHFYPHPQKLTVKIEELKLKGTYKQDAEAVLNAIPTPEDAPNKEQKEEVYEKKAVVIDFNQLELAARVPDKKRERPASSKPHRSQEDEVQRYLAQGSKQIERKKAERKEKNRQKRLNQQE